MTYCAGVPWYMILQGGIWDAGSYIILQQGNVIDTLSTGTQQPGVGRMATADALPVDPAFGTVHRSNGICLILGLT